MINEKIFDVKLNTLFKALVDANLAVTVSYLLNSVFSDIGLYLLFIILVEWYDCWRCEQAQL